MENANKHTTTLQVPSPGQHAPEANEMTPIHHPLTAEDRAAITAMRSAMPPTKIVLGPESRAPFDEIMSHTPDAPGVAYEPARVGGVPGWWVRPEGAPEHAALLYLHGGAYVVGSAGAARHLAGQLAARAGAAAFVADYRLAPEHPFPAAPQDALAAYRGLAAGGYTAIALAGDSAGGGLALVTLAQAVAEARGGTLPRPSGAAVMSPWADLSLGGASLESRADADPLLSRETLAHAAGLYLAQHDPRDPLASPLYGDLADLPPVLLHVGEDEVLLDDALRYADRVVAAGGEARVHVWTGMTHVFPSGLGVLAAAAPALDDLGAFLGRQLRRKQA